MISVAMGSALASVSSVQSQISMSSQQPLDIPAYKEQDGGTLGEDSQHGSEEEKEPDEVDNYDKSIDSIIGNQEGPDLLEKVGRVLEKCLGLALDEKMVKEKRKLYPKPGNIVNSSVPRLNPEPVLHGI